MEKYTVQYALLDPRDECKPLRKWITISVYGKNTVFATLYNYLIDNNKIPFGKYLTIYEVIEETEQPE